MRVLIVGGTGLIGASAATVLRRRGYDITIGARQKPSPESSVADLHVLLGDYAASGFGERDLESFDAVVFAAGQDVRHVEPHRADEQFWERFQSGGVPDFVSRAKRAGVRRVVQIGSYYHMVMPELRHSSPYVRARWLADDRSRAHADADFNVCTLNPPAIVGLHPGTVRNRFAKLVAWALGDLVGEVPDFAPPGGTNYMSVTSLAEAIDGALLHAESGAAYLLGDENYTYREYFQLIIDLVGGRCRLPELDREHPLLPDRSLVAGRGKVVAYEPPPSTVELLGFSRNRVRATLEAMIRDIESES
jgi:dihydroflavonol-4-reductase